MVSPGMLEHVRGDGENEAKLRENLRLAREGRDSRRDQNTSDRVHAVSTMLGDAEALAQLRVARGACAVEQSPLGSYDPALLDPCRRLPVCNAVQRLCPILILFYVISGAGPVFVQFLHERHLVDFHLGDGVRAEIFFVKKKGGRLRMVANCRRSNEVFAEPLGVRLAIGDAFGPLEMADDDALLTVEGADLKDALYHLELPEELRSYFTLGPVRAGAGGKSARPPTKLFPRLRVAPMGWSSAMWWCQSVTERVAEAAGCDDATRLRDGRLAPALNPARHLEYVDNFVSIGYDATAARTAFSNVMKELRRRGLVVTHEAHLGDNEGEYAVLGWSITSSGRLSASSSRLWRFRLAVRGLLRRGRAPGQDIERVLGHIIFVALARREGFSILESRFRFVQECDHREVPLWSRVRQGLMAWDGVAPLLWRDLHAQWSPSVGCVGASPRGLGACDAEWEVAAVREVGRHSERWRYGRAERSPPRLRVHSAESAADAVAACGPGLEAVLPPPACQSGDSQAVGPPMLFSIMFGMPCGHLGIMVKRLSSRTDIDVSTRARAAGACADMSTAMTCTDEKHIITHVARERSVSFHMLWLALFAAALSRFPVLSSALLLGSPRARPAAASDVPPAAASLARAAPGPGGHPVDWPVLRVSSESGPGSSAPSTAIGVLLEIHGRPGEVHGLQLQGAMLASAAASGAHRCVSAPLRARDVGDISKPGEFDASARLPLDRRAGLAGGLLVMAAARCRAVPPAAAPLFAVSQRAVAEAWRKAAMALGLAKLGSSHVCQLCHSGRSLDYAASLRDLEHIGRQGYWKSRSSVRRCEMGGRPAELLHLLPAVQRQHARACAVSLSQSCHCLPSPGQIAPSVAAGWSTELPAAPVLLAFSRGVLAGGIYFNKSPTSAAKGFGLPDPLAAAPAPAALPAPAAPPAAAAPPVGGGLGALAAALGGGAPAPAAAAAAPAGVGGALAPPAAAAAVGDPRAMALVLDGRGLRDLSFGDALKHWAETVRADWPVKRPRPMLWILGFTQRMAGGSMHVELHETMCRVIETALCRDQIVICELASFEYLAHQLQLVEEGVCEERARRTQPAPKAKALAKEASLTDFPAEVGNFLGTDDTDETKGELRISLAMMGWIADQMKNEAAVAKERRKAREERALRAPWRTPRTLTTMGLASTLFLLERLVSHAQSPSGLRLWCNEGLSALNWLHCGKDEQSAPREGARAPAVQAASVEHLASQHREFELPAARSAPGCAGDSGRGRPCSKSLVAWPKSTKAVSTADVVSEADSIVLQGWGQSMLDPESVAAELRGSLGVLRPRVDPELRHRPKPCAQFLKQLEASDATLAFDTRLANCSFAAPPATRLPTPGARASADCDGSFAFAQGDIQCAFCHLRLPAGMESLFPLPAISHRCIGFKSINGAPIGINDFVQPLVTVVPMGWSWTLHFGQSALTRALSDVGFQDCEMILDGGSPRPLVPPTDALCAGCVDNFCVVSKSPEIAAPRARAVADLLAARGLPALDFSPAVSNGGLYRVTKATRAQTVHPGPASLLRGSPSVLGDSAVSAATGRGFKNSSELDVVLAVLLAHFFIDGYDSATGRMAMAALKHHHPSMLAGGRPLRRAFRSFQGWAELAPPQTRLPLPRVAMFAIAGAPPAQGRLSEVTFARLAFDAYLRPSGARRLAVASLIAPRIGSTEGHQHWAIFVSDAASGRPGKAGATDESAIVDDPHLLEALRQGRRPEASLRSFPPDQVRRALEDSLVQLQLDGEQTSPCSLRRGGAPDDLLSGRRAMKEVEDRGRWMTHQSLKRYATRARMKQLLGQLSPALVDFGDMVEQDFLNLMEVQARTGIFSSPLPPLLPATTPPPARAAPVLTDQWSFARGGCEGGLDGALPPRRAMSYCARARRVAHAELAKSAGSGRWPSTLLGAVRTMPVIRRY
ncbi:unnamed protein product [Prorocentrum cordatum]|uniref:Reverse transcriptase domain-containing protein n=1 Tax=Prorocentrum cordatum TaxID=2364126 RepID=A0ABN9XIB6_9DINO|nr:unnamed protein product [Polarella glacialis]